MGQDVFPMAYTLTIVEPIWPMLDICFPALLPFLLIIISRISFPDLTETVFKAVASGLANQLSEEEEDRENEDLTQASLVEYFLEVILDIM